MPELTPELISALAPYGIGGLALVVAFFIYMDRQKTKRVRIASQANRRPDPKDVEL